MRFAEPNMFWLLAVTLPALGLFFWWAWRKRRELMAQFIQARLLANLTASVSFTRQKIRMGLLLGAVFFIYLALARPQWGFSWQEVHERGLDIVVAIDTSRSMLAGDIAPNRLTRAKLAALDLMKSARTDRLGLVAFAGTAFLQCPLTLDEAAFRQSVTALDTDIIPQGGTAIAEAIETAAGTFKQEEDNHKIIVLFTDGEDHEDGAVEAAGRAAKAGIRIFTVGVGTPNGELLQITDENGKKAFLKDDNGEVVKSHLNENLLREIATVAKGFYLPLSGSKTVETLYEKGLAPLPKADLAAQTIRQHTERFQWPLCAAMILLLVEMFLPDHRRREAVGTTSAAIAPAYKASTIALLLLFLTPGLQASPASARQEYENGHFRDAEQEYEQLLEKKPDDPRLNYNAGTAAYRAGQFDKAAKNFEAALLSPDIKLQQSAYYNHGNSLFRQGENAPEPEAKDGLWKRSIEDYERALKLSPQDPDSKHNLEFVKKKLEELKQQQQQQQKQSQQDSKKNDQANQQNKPQPEKAKDQKKPDESKQNQAAQNKKSKEKKQPEEQKTAKKNADKAGQADQKKDEGAQQAGKSENQKGKPDSKESPAGAAQAAYAVALTKEQAQQLLDSVKDSEKALIFQPKEKTESQKKAVKNW